MSTPNDAAKSVFYGIGVGPGDPDLLTIKSYKILRQASAISYLVNRSGFSLAKSIVDHFLPEKITHIPIHIDMSIHRDAINTAYSMGAIEISRLLRQGKNVVFLCEGDPLFYGSFNYLLDRLGGSYPCEIIPGITSMQAASSKLLQPLGALGEKIAIINTRSSDEEIMKALLFYDTLVIMKIGKHALRIIQLIEKAQRQKEAIYCERLYQEQEMIIFDLDIIKKELRNDYFSLFLVSKHSVKS